VQVNAFVDSLDGENAVFSAKDVYERLDHPARHEYKSSIGKINQLLHQAWSEGRLISFADTDGSVLREEQFVAPGSRAVEHPQIFAAPGTPSPKDGFAPVTYAEHHSHSGGGAVAEAEPEADSAAEADGAAKQEELADLPPEVVDDIVERLFSPGAAAPAPQWVPEPLMREWVTQPCVLKVLRDGLDQASKAERQQLILTGIGRKGPVAPDSPTAGALARLCYQHAAWWGRVAGNAMRDYSRADRSLTFSDISGLPDNLDDLLADYDAEVIVLTCLRLGDEGDEVQVVATEAAEALGTTAVAAAVDEEIHSLRSRLELAESERREAERELKDEKQKRRAAEQKSDTHARELERLRTQTAEVGDAAVQLAEMQRELTQAQSEFAARTAELEAAREDADRALELEAELTAAEAELVASRDTISASQAQLARGRQAEQELQQALRTIGELNVRIANLEQHAGALPVLDDARSLVQLLDGAIGSLVADAAERIRGGEAREEDRQLLAFAAQFVDFKAGIVAAPAPPATEAAVTPEPEAESAAVELATPAAEPDAALEEDGRRAAVTRRVRTRLGWTVKPLGGAGEIGASAILATTPSGHSVLLDAGQRVRGVYGSASNDYDFHYGVAGVDELAAVLVSHAHIDHTGSLPVLHRNQSAQQQRPIPVYMSEPTIELAQIMMADSAKIQHARERERRDLGESDFAEEMATNRPAYDMEEVRRVAEACVPAVPYRQFEIPNSGIVARFEPVPHVLGACAIHLTDVDSGATLLYTGDLGPIADPQLTLPDFNGVEHITPADLMIIESTYGKQAEVAAPDGRSTGAPPAFPVAPATGPASTRSPATPSAAAAASCCRASRSAARRRSPASSSRRPTATSPPPASTSAGWRKRSSRCTSTTLSGASATVASAGSAPVSSRARARCTHVSTRTSATATSPASSSPPGSPASSSPPRRC
jgi:ribonuclease BN (tRNA processing enzyme)